METIRGRVSREFDIAELKERVSGYKHILLDLGTGDGRYVRWLAERHPHWFVLGADTCRENLHEHSRAKLPNMLFIIAAAQALPRELNGMVAEITINFPWGSLLKSLLTADSALTHGLQNISQPVTSLQMRLNGGAMAEAGTTLEAGAGLIGHNLSRCGWLPGTPAVMDGHALRAFPSTWARRLAVGRDPRALVLSGWFARLSQQVLAYQNVAAA